MVVVLVALAAAHAQEVESPSLSAQAWRLPVDATGTLWADDARPAPDGWATARLAADWVDQPLIAVPPGGEKVAIVSQALGLDLVGGYVSHRIRIGLDAPYYPVAQGDLASGGGLGDIALDGKVTFTGDQAPVGSALGLRLSFPTADTAVPLGAGGVAWEVSGIVDKPVQSWLFAGNLALSGAPRVELPNVVVGTGVTVRLGASYAVNDDFGLSGDLGLRTSAADFGQAAGSPMEAILGVHDRLGGGNVVVRAGAGAGLTPGIGSPVARAILAIGWEPSRDRDPDHDGVFGKADACPTEPEDVDGFEDANGCPDPDNDQDGLADLADRCSNEPEDKDGWKDDDGCPDIAVDLVVHAVTKDGKPVPGAEIVVTGGPDPMPGAGGMGVREVGTDTLTTSLRAGHYDGRAEAKGYKTVKQAIDLPDGPPVALSWTMEPDVQPGHLIVDVVDEKGKPVTGATWTVADQPSAPIADGVGKADVLPGPVNVLVQAEGYAPVELSADVGQGQTIERKAVMRAAKVKVTREKLDILDKIYFDTGKATIKKESFGLLDEIAAVIQSRPDILQVSIEGHTDSRGDDASNLDLSTRRAAAVKDYLVKKGIDASRLTSIGYGETKPIDPANNSAAWDKNRRVEFVIVKWADDEEK